MPTYDYEELVRWNSTVDACPMPDPAHMLVDFHRLQIERWLWDNRDRLINPVSKGYPPRFRTLDIGAEWRRAYLDGQNQTTYLTFNTAQYDTSWHKVRPDLLGSIIRLPFADDSLDAIICTETLEHVFNVFQAVAEIKRVLRPGRWVFLTTPFLWPTHGTTHYKDYWRIAPDAYYALFHEFQSVLVTHNELSAPAKSVLPELTGYEVMGDGWNGTLPSGLLIAARK